MTKISIIIPVYNPPEEYFEYCCENLLNQSYTDFEVILVNNAATGNVPNLIKKYCDVDPRFKTYQFEENVGFSGACNKGLELATGDYVQIVDSDDYLIPNALELENKIIDETNSDIIVFNHYYFDHEKNTEVPNEFPSGINEKPHEVFKLSEKSRWLLEISMCAWNKVFKRSFLTKNNLKFDTDIAVAAPDVLMSVKSYLLAEKISYLADALYCYRINLPNNVMAKLTKKGVDLYKSVPLFCSKVDDFILQNNISPDIIPCIVKLNLVMLTSNFDRTHKTNKRDFYYLIQKYFKNNKNVYKKENLIKCDKYYVKFFKTILSTPYWLYRLKSNIYSCQERNNIIRKRLFKITIYKKWLSDGLIYKRYIGLFKKKEINFISWFGHIINTLKKEFNPVNNQLKINQELLEQINKKFDDQKNTIDDLNNNIRNLKTIIEAQKIHPDSFGQYKNAFEDKEVVLVCTGPTANNYKPIEGAIHVGVNGAVYLDNVKLDYLFAQDYTVNQKGNETLIRDAYNYVGNNCKKFFGIIPDKWLKASKPLIERIPFKYFNQQEVLPYIIEDIVGHNIAYDLSREPVGDFCGTVFSALQFILYTNPKKLYLVGWDCSSGYAYGKENAMTPADYQKEIVEQHFVPYIKLNFPDLEIISINPVGLKGIFEDVYTQIEEKVNV